MLMEGHEKLFCSILFYLARVRKKGDVALAVSTSENPALLLDGCMTSHSRFKIPLDINSI